MLKELRKIVTFDEDIYSEGGKEANPILRIVGVAAVLSNPWKGRGFVEDLQPEIKRIAPVMGKALTDRLISMVGTGEKIEAFVSVKEFDDNHYIAMATRNGIVKKTVLSEYGKPRKAGIYAIH